MKDFGTGSNDTDDPFSSDEDPEKTENNEVCIEEDDEEDSDGESSTCSNVLEARPHDHVHIGEGTRLLDSS